MPHIDYRVQPDAEITVELPVSITAEGVWRLGATEDDVLLECTERMTFRVRDYDEYAQLIDDATVTPLVGDSYVSKTYMTRLILDQLLLSWSFTDKLGALLPADWENAKSLPYPLIMQFVDEYRRRVEVPGYYKVTGL